MKQRDSFIFYRSFFEAINNLDYENQGKIYHAICAYNFTQTEPEFSGICQTVWILIKPQLDANIKRFQNGNKQKRSKPQASSKQKRSKTEANNNVNDNVNEKGELNSINFSGLLKFINNTLGKNYQVLNGQLKNKYNARLKDGYTKEQIMSAIINASKDAYHVETKFKYLTPEFFSRSTIIDKYGFTSTKENEETKPDTLMDWEWEAMLRNREEVRKIQAYAAKEK